jgi:tetratricopeptide (TPR) repeat protein
VSEPSQESTSDELPHRVRTPGNSLSAAARAREIERSLAELSDARRAVNAKEHPEEWAELTVKLGDVYRRRKAGGKAENLELAIQCYDEALTVYDWQRHPKEFVICNARSGQAYLKLSDGQQRLLKEISLVHYQMALALISKESWPELWHTVHLELALLFRKYTQSPGDEDAGLSDEHYKIAFDLDQERFPELHDHMSTNYKLHLRLFALEAERRDAEFRERGE